MCSVVEESGPTRSKIVLEPLEQGFGHTLGNALPARVAKRLGRG